MFRLGINRLPICCLGEYACWCSGLRLRLLSGSHKSNLLTCRAVVLEGSSSSDAFCNCLKYLAMIQAVVSISRGFWPAGEDMFKGPSSRAPTAPNVEIR